MNPVVEELIRNLPVIGSTLLILWLALPQLADRFAIIAKLVAPFSRKGKQRAKEVREQAERDRLTLLAEAQSLAQTTATTATTAALVVVREQCANCLAELRKLRDASGCMIDVLEEVLPLLPPDHQQAARESIRHARSVM